MNFDRTKYQQLIAARFEKLNNIKDYISRKTFYLIEEKLHNEQLRLENKIQRKEHQLQKENAPQSMPKIFFELRQMKIKQIRID